MECLNIDSRMILNWRITDYIEAKTDNFKITERLAIFDLDCTIIQPIGGGFKYKDASDWEFLYENVRKKLLNISKDGYCIIIITNQAGIEKKQTKIDEWKSKIEQVVEKINLPIWLLCSKSHDRYRKPIPTFFNIIVNILEQKNLKIDMNESFYCGDAAGRLCKKKDHSDTDLKFAKNCNLRFFTPERFFLNDDNQTLVLSYPSLKGIDIETKKNNIKAVVKKNDKELVVMSGYPGSGKSYVSNEFEKLGYGIINRDTAKTIKKCLVECETLMKSGKSVVIDNTNPDIKSRSVYLKLADKYGYKKRSLTMTTPMDISKHNNYYRSFGKDLGPVANNDDNKHDHVPDLVYHIYNKRFEPPTENEGFDTIERVTTGRPKDKSYDLFYF